MRNAHASAAGGKLLLATTFLTLCMASTSVMAQDAKNKTKLDTVVVTAEDESTADGPDGPVIAQEGTVGKSDAPIIDTPRSISVITEQRMNDMGVQTVQDALLYSSGVYGGAYGNDTRGDWSIIRGSEPVEYENGLKTFFGYYNNTRPDSYGLSGVEILKGPASGLYGQGTVGGVVNVVSKRPQAQEAKEVMAEYGSFNHKKVGTDLTGKANADGSVLYRFVGSFQDSEHQTDHVEDNLFSLAPSLTFKPSDATDITVLTHLQRNDSGTGTQFLPHQGTVLPAPNGPIPFSTFISEPGYDTYDTQRESVTVLVDHRFSDVWSLSGAARVMDSSSTYYTMYPSFPPTINPDGTTINRWAYAKEADAMAINTDTRLKADFDTGNVNHKVALGLDTQTANTDESSFFSVNGGTIDLYNPVYGNKPVVTLTNRPSTTTKQGGVYLNDHLTIAEHWILTLGARVDQAITKTDGGTAQEDTAFTKNAGLMYKFDNGISPYVSYAESFNPVIGTDAFGSTFDPLEGVQYEAGVKYQPPGTNSIFTAAVFDITEKNRLTSDPVNPFASVQSGEVGIQGFEVEAQHKWHDFNLLASYTITNAEVEKSNDGNEGFNVEVVPDQMASAWVTYRPSSFWQGFKTGAGIRYVGETWDGADTIQTESYTLGDAMVGYEFEEGVDVTLNAHNITDEEYLTSCLARGDCFLGERRTVMLNVTHRF